MKMLHNPAKLKIFNILFFVMFSLLLFTVQSAYAQKVATLEGVQGDVRVLLPGNTSALKGRNGMALLGKTIIKTTTINSFANVIYNKGTKVRVMPNSEIELSSTEPADQGSIRVKIDLLVGKIFSLVDRLTSNDKFEVQTPTSTAGIKGTFFSVHTTDKISKWVVKEGKVDITNRGCVEKTVQVGPPKTTIVRLCEPPSEPFDMTIDESLEFDEIEGILNQDGPGDPIDPPEDPGELSNDENDAIEEAAEAARQLPLNVTSPKY